ncbi:hypothetical protein LOC68_15930 [Blastopirellula sp. JC732]|uniref:Uncharacterized protein n=1 Tax=Blastopirellula sediminis TaxID=2894196 RepID=A0A9X1MPB1_9BACT|nr:hypothetical protein [Blastopirellula sediminis]MCC9606823.1 hypothetical protein [Blastopirellula sediminis]MCC9629880.1 hypothetical protein [Blastopirellula sediminis]
MNQGKNVTPSLSPSHDLDEDAHPKRAGLPRRFTHARFSTVIPRADPQNRLREMGYVQGKFQLQLKRSDPQTANPCYPEQMVMSCASGGELKLDNSIRPPTAEFVGAICKALAEEPLNEQGDFLGNRTSRF